MKVIDVDGREVWVYDVGEEIAAEVVATTSGYEYRKDAATAYQPLVRRIVVPGAGFEPRPNVFGVAHWDDLERVEDADGALLCDVRDVTCRVCKNSALVATPSTDLPGTSARWAAHRLETRCPNCGDAGFIAHTEVFVA